MTAGPLVGALLPTLLAVAAVLVWPGAPRPGLSRPGLSRPGLSRPGRRESSAEGASVDDAADALELCAMAIRAGLAPVDALEAAARRSPPEVARQLRVVVAAHRWGLPSAQAWEFVGPAWRPAALALSAAEQAGATPAALVADAARRMRETERARVERDVERAGVLLVLPLGLCFLPGFVCTTVVPVVLHLARGMLGQP